jgi:hypothetical protein
MSLARSQLYLTKQLLYQQFHRYDFMDLMDIASDKNQSLVHISFYRIDQGG